MRSVYPVVKKSMQRPGPPLPRARSLPEDTVDDLPRTPRGAQVVVHQLLALPRPVAQDVSHSSALASVTRKRVARAAADLGDRVADPARQPPGLGQRLRALGGEQVGGDGRVERLDGARRPQL